jgi:hypothetical protein
MNSFWLTKRAVIEALKLSEGLPQTAFIHFHVHTEGIDKDEKTIVDINVRDKEKTVKDNFNKLIKANAKW